MLFAAFPVATSGVGETAIASTAANDRVVLNGHVLPALATASKLPEMVKASTADKAITLTLVLKRTDPAGFSAYLADVYDPASPRFRKFLTQAEITERFGPSLQAYEQVLRYLIGYNVQLVEGSSNRMTVIVRGALSDVERAFAVSIDNYKIDDRNFHANSSEPSLPKDVAALVHGVAGLSNLAEPRLPKPQISAIAGTLLCYVTITLAFVAIDLHEIGKANGMTLAQLRALVAELERKYQVSLNKCVTNIWLAYKKLPAIDPPPPAWQGADGTGQTVGLIQFDTYNPTDVADHINLLGLPPGKLADVTQVHVNGGAGPTPGAHQDEVLLDIGNVLTIAPGAKIVVYDAPFTGANTSFQALFNAAINGGSTIISNSWTYCEDQTSLADVQSIDAILQGAAASGISVFNASGDSGTTCLNRAANTVGVPASSPHATAVGGTSMTSGIGHTYGSETWWDGSTSTPATGQGGYGVSRFFERPAYQDSENAGGMRSIPDVSLNADPFNGVIICAASLGGCPTGASYGGTSSSAPAMAAFTALLNQTQGTNLGALNPQMYPLANTAAFHTGASMGSDYAHVGLGSPDFARLHQALTNQTVGPVSASVSQVQAFGAGNATLPSDSTAPLFIYADGTSAGQIVVRLTDSFGNTVSGKSVTLTASVGSNAVITPVNAISNDTDGAAIFSVTNLSTQIVTFTASVPSDAVTIAQTARIAFIPLPAASASIVASAGNAAADGTSSDTITVTLHDALGRPSRYKRVTMAQTGSAVINGPDPAETDANGQIQFTVTNTRIENVLFIATVASDGDVRVPGGAFVTFTAAGGDNCGNTNMGDPNIYSASGYALSAFATGFTPRSVFFGNIGPACRGASGLAFDAAGNLFVAFSRTGDIYKFGAAGGVAGPATLVTPTALGPGLVGLTFGHDGKLYGAFQATTGDFFTGAVKEIDPVTGVVVRTVSTPITCASYIATDPLSGDLFVDDSCSGAGSDNGSIWRINNPGSATPTTTVYAATPGINGGLTFSSGGTLYVLSYTQNGVARISGTDKPQPPTVTVLPGLTGPALNVVALGAQANGDAKTLLISTAAEPSGIKAFDITGNPVTTASLLVNNAYANVQVTGPDGCQYASMSVAVYKITNADGSCPLVLDAPMLSLSPPVVRPDPAQGTAKTFTSSFHFLNVPTDTPVFFSVGGANTLQGLTHTDANGTATFTYTAFNAGSDTVFATATVDNVTYRSNPVKVNWTTGLHTTSIDLNQSPTSGIAGTRATLRATLIDVSLAPAAAISGASVHFAIGSQSCDAVTDATGVATCGIVLPTVGSFTLSATYVGSALYRPASVSTDFQVIAPTSIDIDGNGSVDALTDGMLIMRWLSGVSGPALVNNGIGPNATRVSADDVAAYLSALLPVLDVDLNSQSDSATDGLLILRYLLGFRGDALTDNAVGAGAARSNAEDIAAYIQSLIPQ